MTDKADKPLDPMDYGITSQKMWLYCLAMFTIGSETYDNGTNSARTAGYNGNDNNLAVISSDYLRLPKVQAAKNAIQGNIAKRFVLKAEKVISRLAMISGIADSTDEDKLQTTTSGDQIRSLDLLGKHLKLWDRAGETEKPENTEPKTARELTALDAAATAYKRAMSISPVSETG